MESGIYTIKSKIKPERVYIGSAVLIPKRWRNHLYYLRRNNHANNKLQNHYNKYGEDDLIFEVLLYCDVVNLINSEQSYIDSIQPFFNVCPKAGSCLGIKRTEESKKRYSLSKIGDKNPNYGKPLTEEAKANLISCNSGENHYLYGKPSPLRGIPRTQEVKDKISIANSGENNYMYGKHLSEERKKQLSEANKGNVFSEEHRMKLSIKAKERELKKRLNKIEK